MSILGKRKSKAKAAAARRNGKLGGMTKADMTELQQLRALAGTLPGSAKQKRVARRAAGRAEQKGQK